MLTEFEPGKTYIFDVPTYEKVEHEKVDRDKSSWMVKCHGMRVKVLGPKDGGIDDYSIAPEWCVEEEDFDGIPTE